MKTAVLTGGTGFLGFGLLSELIANDVFVYVVVRQNSKRIERLQKIEGIKIIELNMEDISKLDKHVKQADVFYHLAWEGERNNFPDQMRNIIPTVTAMEVAHHLGVKQFIVTGSQAEYGVVKEVINEATPTNPNTAYGASKLACYQILKTLSEQLKINLTWVRVFSVYGRGDNPNTLISYLFRCFREDKVPELTSGTQYWDYLNLSDAAKALYLLGEKNKSGLYNLASGQSRPLREFIIEVRDLINPNSVLTFDEESKQDNIQLKVDVTKIKSDLDWRAKINFLDGILILNK
jgi:nucleoside-diphosphate-sugar epimerase